MIKKRSLPIRQSKSTSGISTKDQIVLRTKSSNKCSICRRDLVIDKPATRVKLKGEMCHIVGEKVNSPRGKLEYLPLEERNCYSNLILLCKNHHEEIDKDEMSYSIAKLHKIKSDHEEWVEESIINKPLDPEEQVYINLIDTLDSMLQLKSWDWFIDNSVRHIIHSNFIYTADTVIKLQLKTIWPKKYPSLTIAIKELLESYLIYIKQYLDGAEERFGTDFYKPLYPTGNPLNNPDFFYLSDKHELWANINFELLCLFVVKLNQYCESVRQNINPLFYLVRGKFIVIDSLGTHLGEWGAMYSPDPETVKKHLAHLNSKLKKLNKEHQMKRKSKKN